MNHCFTKIKRQIVIIHSSLFCSNGELFAKLLSLQTGWGESCKALLILLGTMKDLKEAYLVGFEWTKSLQPYSVESKSCNGCSSIKRLSGRVICRKGSAKKDFWELVKS